MADHLKESEADQLTRVVGYFESAEQATVDSRALAEKCRDYYDGDQWTAAEREALRKRKQPCTTINRIKPKVDFLLGMETQRRSLPKAYARTPKHETDAQAASDALRYVVEDQNFEVTRSKGFENMAIEGVAGVDVSVVEVNGKKNIRISAIQWDRLFYDPHSRERNFSDAKYLGQVLWMDYADAAAMFKGKDEALQITLQGESALSETHGDVPRIRWADPKRKRVRIVEIWYDQGGKWHHCQFTKGGILSSMESPYKNDEDESVPGFIFGSAFIDRDGNRYGVVKNWIDVQDEINKRRSKAQHLLSVRQVKYEAGAVDNVNRMRQELAKPDGAIEVNPGMMFEVLNTGDMAASQFSLLQEAKQEIDSVGVNAALAGTDQRQMSGRALIARQESGLSELGPLFDSLKQWQLEIYRAAWNRIQQYWDAEKWVRVTDDEKNVRFVGLNQPITLGQQLLEEAQAQGMEITPDMQAQAERDPAMQQIVGTKNNVAELDVDIILDDAPASASVQAEQFETLAGLAKSGLPIPPTAIIKASSLRNKEEILKEMGAGGPSPESQQAQEHIKMLEGSLQELGEKFNDLEDARDIELQKLQLDKYRAETDRLKLIYPTMPAQLSMVLAQEFGLDLVAEQQQENAQGPAPDVQQEAAPEPAPEPAMPPPDPAPEQMQQPEQPADAGFFTPEQAPPEEAPAI